MFDLDGTMVNTAPDLAYAVNEALLEQGLPSRGEDKIRQWVGNGAETLLRVALTGREDSDPEPELLRRCLLSFERVYASNLTRGSTLFPGAMDCLLSLRQRGVDMVCITNKRSMFTEPLLRQLGVDHMFSMVLSGDSLPRCKPHPDQLLHAMRERGKSPDESWMVGDSANDVQAARAAGVRALCVDYGYTRVAAADLGADVVLSRFDQVLELL